MDHKTREFIESLIANGYSEQDIHAALTRAGWKDEHVYDAFQDFYDKRVEPSTRKLTLHQGKNSKIPSPPNPPHYHPMQHWIPVAAAGVFLVIAGALAFGVPSMSANAIYDVDPTGLLKTPFALIIAGFALFFVMMIVFMFMTLRAND